MIHFNRTASGDLRVSSHLTTLSQALFRALHALTMRRRHRRTYRILQSLDDRTLHDIGLDRSEISSIVQTIARDRRQTYLDAVTHGSRATDPSRAIRCQTQASDT